MAPPRADGTGISAVAQAILERRAAASAAVAPVDLPAPGAPIHQELRSDFPARPAAGGSAGRKADAIRNSRRKSPEGVVSMLVGGPEAGRLALPVPDAALPSGVDEVDLTFLLELSALWQPLAHAFERTLAGCKVKVSRATRREDVRSFAAFLMRRGMPDASIGDLTYDTFLAYKRDLDDPEIRPHFKLEYHRGARLNAVQRVACALRKDRRYARFTSRELRPVVNPYPGAKHEIGHVEALKPEELAAVTAAAKLSVEETTRDLKAFWAVSDANLQTVELLALSRESAPHLAALVERLFGGQPLGSRMFRATENRPVKEAIARAGLDGMLTPWGLWERLLRHGSTNVRELLHPSVRTTVPFLILMAPRLALNVTPLFEMELDDVVTVDPLGRDCFATNPLKRRQQGFHPVSWRASDAIDNPRNLYFTLERWGRHARELLPDAWKRRLFVLHAEGGTVVFDHVNGSTNFRRGCEKLSEFAEERFGAPLPAVQLRQFRPTTLEVVDEMADGDISAVMRKGGQRSAETVYQHYATKGVRGAADQQTGIMIAALGRWFATDGEVDPRQILESEDMGAATRGFICLNPFASPIPGQKSGQMCTAVGQCPICPRAAVDATLVLACARLVHLEATMERLAKDDPYTYRARVLAAHRRLTGFWLKLFPAEVREQVGEIPAQPPIRLA